MEKSAMVKSGTLQEIQVIIDSSLENREELLIIIQELKAILKETIAALSESSNMTDHPR